MPRSASLDIHLGRLIRARRRAARWSQKALGARLGVSFQQVQKYESGANRVSAATLYALAGLFRMTPSEFFDGWSLTPPDDRRRDLGAELLGAPGGVQLAEAYLAIPSPRLRARVLALVGEIAGTDGVVRRSGRAA